MESPGPASADLATVRRFLNVSGIQWRPVANASGAARRRADKQGYWRELVEFLAWRRYNNILMPWKGVPELDGAGRQKRDDLGRLVWKKGDDGLPINVGGLGRVEIAHDESHLHGTTHARGFTWVVADDPTGDASVKGQRIILVGFVEDGKRWARWTEESYNADTPINLERTSTNQGHGGVCVWTINKQASKEKDYHKNVDADTIIDIILHQAKMADRPSVFITDRASVHLVKTTADGSKVTILSDKTANKKEWLEFLQNHLPEQWEAWEEHRKAVEAEKADVAAAKEAMKQWNKDKSAFKKSLRAAQKAQHKDPTVPLPVFARVAPVIPVAVLKHQTLEELKVIVRAEVDKMSTYVEQKLHDIGMERFGIPHLWKVIMTSTPEDNITEFAWSNVKGRSGSDLREVTLSFEVDGVKQELKIGAKDLVGSAAAQELQDKHVDLATVTVTKQSIAHCIAKILPAAFRACDENFFRQCCRHVCRFEQRFWDGVGFHEESSTAGVTDEQKADSLTVAELLQVEWRRLIDIARKKEETVQWSQRQAEHNTKQEQLRTQHEQQQQPKKRKPRHTGRQPKGKAAPVLEPFQHMPFTEPKPQPLKFRSIGRGGEVFEPRIEPLESEVSAEGNYALPELGR
jgi:hypothetical protein